MSTVIIEKYIDGVSVEKQQVPAALLRFVSGLLPSSAYRQLLRHGLDIDTLLNEQVADSEPQWMDIKEKGVTKRIRISRHDSIARHADQSMPCLFRHGAYACPIAPC